LAVVVTDIFAFCVWVMGFGRDGMGLAAISYWYRYATDAMLDG
jgi:hypothetical protein